MIQLTMSPCSQICVDRYGWRCLSPLEKEAYHVFWSEIGRRLNIQDIPTSIEGMITRRKVKCKYLNDFTE